MWRCAFKFENDPFGLWIVAKCYDIKPGAEPYTLPVKLDRDHGIKRQQLLILSPERVPTRTFSTPYEVLRAYLRALPVEEKDRRAAELRAAA